MKKSMEIMALTIGCFMYFFFYRGIIVYAGSQSMIQWDDCSTQPVIYGLGDSILYGDELEDTKDSFITLLGKHLNYGKVFNYGLAGSAVSGKNVDRFIDRYASMDKDADYVFVMGGTNDYGYSVPLGSLNDTSDETFYGGLYILIEGLIDRYGKDAIILLTPIHRVGGEKKNQQGNRLSEYVQAVLDMGSLYGIKTVDLYHAEELDFTDRRTECMPDGLHPNEAGHKEIAKYISRVLIEKDTTVTVWQEEY